MKVLHITNNYPTDRFPIYGIFVKEQVESLDNLGVDNSIMFINGREGGKKEYLFSPIRIRKHLKCNRYDLIHCHHSFSAVMLILSGRIWTNRCVVSYQNPPDREGGILLFKLIPRLFHQVILKHDPVHLRQSKLLYLPNGVNIDFFRPLDKQQSKSKLRLDVNKRYILFMDSNNRKRKQKRIDRFNQVISHLRADFHLKDIEPLILTNTKRELVPYYINASELHLLTSDFEGSPNSVKECLSCNVPVVSTDVGNVRDIMGDIPGCYISDSLDSLALAGCVMKALETNEIDGRKAIIDKGLDMKSVASKLMTVYQEILQ